MICYLNIWISKISLPIIIYDHIELCSHRNKNGSNLRILIFTLRRLMGAQSLFIQCSQTKSCINVYIIYNVFAQWFKIRIHVPPTKPGVAWALLVSLASFNTSSSSWTCSRHTGSHSASQHPQHAKLLCTQVTLHILFSLWSHLTPLYLSLYLIHFHHKYHNLHWEIYFLVYLLMLFLHHTVHSLRADTMSIWLIYTWSPT